MKKRKLNESIANHVKIDVTRLVNDYPELLGTVDDLAALLEEQNPDVVISQEDTDDSVYMIVDGLTQDEIIDVFTEDYYIDDVDSYFVDDTLSEDIEYDDYEDDAEYSDYDEDEYDDDMDLEGDNWDEVEDDDIPDYDDVNVDDEDDDVVDIPDYDDVNIDDEDDDMYESTEYDDDDSLNDSDDEEFDECMEDDEFDEFDECVGDDCMDEDAEFECYESLHRKNLSKMLHEKKTGCCPPKKGRKTVNLYEALNNNTKLTINDIINDVKRPTLTKRIVKNAMQKAVNESAKPVNKEKADLIMLREHIGTKTFNAIAKAMKEGKKTLYTKKTINGKNISEYSSKELLKIFKEINEKYEKEVLKYKTLNESVSKKTTMDSILKKEHIMRILDEELTYRLVFKQLQEKKKAKLNEDDENPLEPLPVAPDDMDTASTDDASADTTDDKAEDKADDTENPDEDDVVELSRVVITVANEDAANELKDSMVNAGIPEDVIEIETESDEEEEDAEEENSTEETEGDVEVTDDDKSNEEDKESNESLHYNKFKKLLEDDETDDAAADTETDDSEGDAADDPEDSADNENADDKESDGNVKVVLTDTDYVQQLADVLNTEYGITKEEFEEMIGGEIISDDAESDEDKKDDKESKEDETSKGDDAVDSMTQEELDKLFGGN